MALHHEKHPSWQRGMHNTRMCQDWGIIPREISSKPCRLNHCLVLIHSQQRPRLRRALPSQVCSLSRVGELNIRTPMKGNFMRSRPLICLVHQPSPRCELRSRPTCLRAAHCSPIGALFSWECPLSGCFKEKQKAPIRVGSSLTKRQPQY